MEDVKRSASESEPLATIVITQRETFSSTQESLDSILAITPPPFDLVYVDAGSPKYVQRYLARVLGQKRCVYKRFDTYLSPNQARNVGLREVKTRYVVFVDNDVVVAPGWFEALITCAEETGAWAVVPIYCIGREPHQYVHMAGGDIRVEVENGEKMFYEEHFGVGSSLAEITRTLQRQPVKEGEFHCLLVRMDAFDRLGPLDEDLLSTADHLDLSMAIKQAGGQIYIEPRSVVTYTSPPEFRWSDLAFFLLRWSTRWNRQSIHAFSSKWGLGDSEDSWQKQHFEWLERHRRMYLDRPPIRYVRGALRRLWGQERQDRMDTLVDRWITRLVVH
jgi:GT2 family glycosyltransferase